MLLEVWRLDIFLLATYYLQTRKQMMLSFLSNGSYWIQKCKAKVKFKVRFEKLLNLGRWPLFLFVQSENQLAEIWKC